MANTQPYMLRATCPECGSEFIKCDSELWSDVYADFESADGKPAQCRDCGAELRLQADAESACFVLAEEYPA